MEIISTKNAPAAIGPYSQGVKAGDLLFISGQIPIDPKNGEICGTTIEEQALQVMKNIEGVLKAADMTFHNVVKTTCFLKDMNDFAGFNKVYGDYFTSRPARSCVAVKEIPKGVLCEVELIACCSTGN